MKTLIFFITIIAATSLVRAGEIVPVWNQEWDINPTIAYQSSLGQKFLKGHDEFLMIGTDIGICSMQIRETKTGKIVRSETTNLVYEENDFEILPDSSSFIMSVGGLREGTTGFEVRNLENFSIINKFEVPLEGDSTTEFGNKYVNRIIDVTVDPIRPFVYFIVKKALPVQSVDEEKEYYAIKVYNYATGEEIRELRTYENDYLEFIDVSHDGKYLASLNEGESFLNVCELDSFKQIRDYELDKSNSDNYWRENVEDLEFSKLNSDIIYFSGSFSRIGSPEEFENGVFEYSIERNNHLNRLPDNGYSGKLIFVEEEKILFLNTGFQLLFFNFSNEILELFNSQPKEFLIGTNAIYSSIYKSFITSTDHQLNSFQYLTQTNIENQDQSDGIIYPNPTTNNIQLVTSCELNEVQLELMDVNGSLLVSEITPLSNGNITFDLSEFPSGSYFIRLKCNEQISTYNIVKEG